MGGGTSTYSEQSKEKYSENEKSRSRSASESRREQSVFPIERLRLVLLSEHGIDLVMKFISKCRKDGKSINFLWTLRLMRKSRKNNYYDLSQDFVDSFLINNKASAYLVQHLLKNHRDQQHKNDNSDDDNYESNNNSHNNNTNNTNTTNTNSNNNNIINNTKSHSNDNIDHKSDKKSTYNLTKALDILENNLANLLVCLTIGVFPEFLCSSEYRIWQNYEQLKINALELQYESLTTPGEDCSDYLKKMDPSKLPPLIKSPEWILALSRSFDKLPFPICIHSSTFPHAFLYANEIFLKSCQYSRSELYQESIEILLTNPFDYQASFPDLSMSDQYIYFEEYEGLIYEVRESLVRGRPSKCVLTSFTKSHDTVCNLMTLIPITNLIGEYVYMLSIHCDYLQHINNREYLYLLDNFIHCIPYRIHHTKYDYNILQDAYIPKEQIALEKLNKIISTEDDIV